MLIGPGMPDDERAGELMDDARQRVRAMEDDSGDRGRTARRLFVAFVLSAFVAVLSFVVLPKWGVYLPPMVPVLGFIVILLGTVLGSREDGAARKPACGVDDEGRPICCSGPRPLRTFRER